MAPPTPRQQRIRASFESAIGLAAPFLDGLLAVGERVSRVAGREDDYIPLRAGADRIELTAASVHADRRLDGPSD